MTSQPPQEQQPLAYGRFTQEIKGADHTHGGNVNSIVNTLSSINRRLRILEDRYANLRRKTQITDQNMLSNSKRLTEQIKNVNEDIKDAKKDIYSMKEKLSLFVKELETCARSEDVNVIENYVNLWSPIQFVTQKEARSLIVRILQEVEDGTLRDGKQSETFNKVVEPPETIREVDENSRP